MGTMMNRVLHIPTLFERQERVGLFINELIILLIMRFKEGLRNRLLEEKAKADECRRKRSEYRKQIVRIILILDFDESSENNFCRVSLRKRRKKTTSQNLKRRTLKVKKIKKHTTNLTRSRKNLKMRAR